MNQINGVIQSHEGFQIHKDYKGKDFLYQLKFGNVKYEHKKITDASQILYLGTEETVAAGLFVHKLIGLAEIAVSLAAKAYDLTLNYSSGRILFKQTLNDFQFIQLKFIEMESKLFQMRALIYMVKTDHMNQHADSKPLSIIVKFISTEYASSIVQDCMQIYGANGLVNEIYIPKFIRLAKDLQQMGFSPVDGRNEICSKPDLRINPKVGSIYSGLGQHIKRVNRWVHKESFDTLEGQYVDFYTAIVICECMQMYSSELLCTPLTKEEEDQIIRLNHYFYNTVLLNAALKCI